MCCKRASCAFYHIEDEAVLVGEEKNRTRARINTLPDDTEASASGGSGRACVARMCGQTREGESTYFFEADYSPPSRTGFTTFKHITR